MTHIIATTDNLTLQQNTTARRFQVLDGETVVFESRQQAVAEVEYIARGGMLPVGLAMPRERARKSTPSTRKGDAAELKRQAGVR